jgi:dienelactone hydrolase
MTEQAEEVFTFAPPRRNFSPWYAWMQRLSATEQEDPFPGGDGEGILAWRERCAGRLDELLGPQPTRVPLDFEVLESEDCGTYRRESVVFDTEADMSVPAFLLVPKDRTEPGPAMLAIHGHGPGKSIVCGIEVTEAPNGDYAHQLALRGYVVLAPDLRCFGQRGDWNPPDHYGCDTNLVHSTMAGEVPLSQNLWDMQRCIDMLSEHPLVDPDQIGACGLSYGGTMSLFLGATDERVAAVVVSGYMSSWAEAHKMPWNMCGSQVLPGMLGKLEHVDLGALVAPRPLLVESGKDDDLFPVAVATRTVAELRQVYDALDAEEDALAHDVFDGGHQWHGDVAYGFLQRWLA